MPTPATYGPFGLPLPQGEPCYPPTCFDEVAPVVVAFVRNYLPGPSASWYSRGSEWAVFGRGCSGSGSTAYQAGWIDLVSAPVLRVDESLEDLSKPFPREPGDWQHHEVLPSSFPADLRHALQLVIEHDRFVMAQQMEELQGYASNQMALPRSEQDPKETSNPKFARLASLADTDTCLSWRQHTLGLSYVPRPRAPGR